MLPTITDSNWREYLPASYNWTQSVRISAKTDFSPGTLTVVPVIIGKDKSVEIPSTKISDSDKTSLLDAIKALDWKGQTGQQQLGCSFGQALLVSVSQLKVSSPQVARQIGIDCSSFLKGRSIDKVCILDAGKGIDPLDIFEGMAAGLYDAQLFKGSRKKLEALPSEVSFVGQIDDQELTKRRSIAASSMVSRMMQDAPANVLIPEAFSAIARSIANEAGFKINVFDRKQMQEMGMGSFLSVAAGSPLEPQFICVEVPGADSSKTVSLVGKGLTFDAGGISIKPSAAMDEMKYDMSGGAAVIGSLHHFSKVKPATNVMCLVGAVENMCSGTATRPGDVVVASNGKSIEVQNTDAEGRLVLADVLSYTVKNHKPDLIIDAATLTGSALHALGHCGAALMSNDDHTADFVLTAAKEVGEPLWQLPLWPELQSEMSGKYGDLVNIPTPNVKAGTIIGGMFLQEFIGDSKWVHLDIAGTAWSCSATGYVGGSGSGFGLKTMVAAVDRFNR